MNLSARRDHTIFQPLLVSFILLIAPSQKQEPTKNPNKKSLARRPGITNLSIHTSFREAYQPKPEAGLLASGCIHPPSLPGPIYEASDSALGGLGDGSPVTVAGPRRSFTGFPFQPRLIGATIRLYSIVNAGMLFHILPGVNQTG